MRHVTSSGLTLIKQFEGFAPNAYICPAGYKTIGYGHLVKDGEKFDEPIDEARANVLLQEDVSCA